VAQLEFYGKVSQVPKIGLIRQISQSSVSSKERLCHYKRYWYKKRLKVHAIFFKIINKKNAASTPNSKI